ncbi:hypothetical protein B0H14DRAFT_2574807 [Mycena olivaceomarginata]|nr:hypothetical protein B0H14DRAFT_2574807 [Mycena olivaceomarginata]
MQTVVSRSRPENTLRAVNTQPRCFVWTIVVYVVWACISVPQNLEVEFRRIFIGMSEEEATDRHEVRLCDPIKLIGVFTFLLIRSRTLQNPAALQESKKVLKSPNVGESKVAVKGKRSEEEEKIATDHDGGSVVPSERSVSSSLPLTPSTQSEESRGQSLWYMGVPGRSESSVTEGRGAVPSCYPGGNPGCDVLAYNPSKAMPDVRTGRGEEDEPRESAPAGQSSAESMRVEDEAKTAFEFMHPPGSTTSASLEATGMTAGATIGAHSAVIDSGSFTAAGTAGAGWGGVRADLTAMGLRAGESEASEAVHGGSFTAASTTVAGPSPVYLVNVGLKWSSILCQGSAGSSARAAGDTFTVAGTAGIGASSG